MTTISGKSVIIATANSHSVELVEGNQTVKGSINENIESTITMDLSVLDESSNTLGLMTYMKTKESEYQAFTTYNITRERLIELLDTVIKDFNDLE